MSISNVTSGTNTSLANDQAKLAKTLLESLKSQPTLLDLMSNDSTSSNASGDILDLSSDAQNAADQLFQLLASSEANSLQTAENKAGENVAQKLRDAFTAGGVDTSQEVDLQVDGDGNVIVANKNPQKQQIEDLINGDPELKKLVSQYLEFMKTMASAAQNDGNSSNALNGENLTTLLASYYGTATDAPDTVTLTLTENGFQTSYQGADGTTSVLVEG
jgi:hypothetical protein